jgi:hypothetical protein
VSEPQLPEQSPAPATQPQPAPPQQRPPAGDLVHYPKDGGAVVPTKAPKNRRQIWRTIGIVVGGVLALLLIGGLGIGYLEYRKASEPDRGTPTLAVQQYVEAKLNTRDDSRADQFTCKRSLRLAAVDALRDDIKGKESQFGVSIRTRSENFDAARSGDSATVEARLRLRVMTGSVQEQFQNWRFQLRDESGWRVCAAERVG